MLDHQRTELYREKQGKRSTAGNSGKQSAKICNVAECGEKVYHSSDGRYFAECKAHLQETRRAPARTAKITRVSLPGLRGPGGTMTLEIGDIMADIQKMSPLTRRVREVENA